eukprot:g6949.t1
MFAVKDRLRQIVSRRKFSNPCSDRRASVLVILFEHPEDGELSVWLTKRSQFVSRHKGEVCLPGGKWEQGDEDDIDTALREAHEEVGLDPSSVDLLSFWPVILLHGNLEISVVIAKFKPGFENFKPILNPRECASAFAMPLKSFLRAAGHSSEDFPGLKGFDGEENNRNENQRAPISDTRRIHHFKYFDKETNETYTIWGLTATIMIEVSKISLNSETEFDCYGNGPNLQEILLKHL